MSEIITLEKYPEGDNIGLLTMNDSVNKNTYTDEFVDRMIEILNQLQMEKKYNAIIIKGLDDVFCAGAALSALMGIEGGDVSVKDLVLSELLIQVPVPTIAAMEGAAVGGGFVFALCSDIMIMNEKKMYGTNFTNMGFTPGMGCTRLVQTAVGDYIGNEMMFRGRLFKGKTFKGRSLINHIVPQEKIMPLAETIALDMDEKPRKTLEILKYSVALKKRQLLAEARVHEDFMHQISFNLPETKKNIEKAYNKIR